MLMVLVVHTIIVNSGW